MSWRKKPGGRDDGKNCALGINTAQFLRDLKWRAKSYRGGRCACSRRKECITHIPYFILYEESSSPLRHIFVYIVGKSGQAFAKIRDRPTQEFAINLC